MPEVEVHWYDGGMMPEFPKGWPAGKQLMREVGGMTIFHGTKDTLVCGALGFNPFLLSGRTPSVPKTRIDAKVNAVQYISELLKHTYREGLPL